MTAWHSQRLRVTLKTPLKCGDRPFGFISRALPFVPSHVPLMAMAPAAVSLLGLPDVPESYYGIQRFLEKNMRFSPFFLVDTKAEGRPGEPLFPFSKSLSLDRIESLFLSARYGVAIDYGIRGAKDARLFEVESIQPVDRNGHGTVLEGHVFWRPAIEQGQELDDRGHLNGLSLERLFAQSRWGGERNKGYGDVYLKESTPANDFWGGALSLEGDAPEVQWPGGKTAPFYLKYDEGLNQRVSGRLQPIVGRLFVPGRGPGQAASEVLIAWDLGWRVQTDLRLEIGVRAAAALG